MRILILYRLYSYIMIVGTYEIEREGVFDRAGNMSGWIHNIIRETYRR